MIEVRKIRTLVLTLVLMKYFPLYSNCMRSWLSPVVLLHTSPEHQHAKLHAMFFLFDGTTVVFKWKR